MAPADRPRAAWPAWSDTPPSPVLARYLVARRRPAVVPLPPAVPPGRARLGERSPRPAARWFLLLVRLADGPLPAEARVESPLRQGGGGRPGGRGPPGGPPPAGG